MNKRFRTLALIMLCCAAPALAGGGGSMSVSTSAVTGNTLVMLEFSFTVGAGGMTSSGRFTIQTPSDWTSPTLTAAEWTAGALKAPDSNLTISTGTNMIIAAPSANVGAGTVLRVKYWAYTPHGPLNNIIFPVSSAFNAADAVAPIAVQPYVSIVAGTAVGLMSSNNGTVLRSSPTAVTIYSRDNSWNTVPVVGAPIIVQLSPRYMDTTTWQYEPDTTAVISMVPDMSVAVSSVVIPVDADHVTFYYRTASTASYTVVQATHSLGGVDYLSLWFNLINGGIADAKIHTGDYAAQKQVHISAGTLAYIDFSLQDTINWMVSIATAPTSIVQVRQFWGYGQPSPGQVCWDGVMNYYDPTSLMMHNNELAPSGTYYVRIQLGGAGTGGIADTSLSVVVENREISGLITDAADPAHRVSGVAVRAYGPTCAYALSDATGAYRLTGLQSGTYSIQYEKYGYATRTDMVTVGPGTTARDVALQAPAVLLIGGRRGLREDGAVEDPEQWGSVSVADSNGSGMPAGGTLHFAVDVSTSDNGMGVSGAYEINNEGSASIYQPGRWTIMQVTPGTFTLHADLPGYTAPADTETYVGAGTTKTVLFDFPLKKMATGCVTLPLPNPQSWSQWVSLEATRAGDPYPSQYSCVEVAPGFSRAAYALNGLDAGYYTISATLPGYKKGSRTVTVAGDAAVAVPDIALTEGGTLSGVVTVEGDTTDAALADQLGGGSTYYTLYVNAWSPDARSYGWTSVNIDKHSDTSSAAFSIAGLEDGTYWVNAWLSGFELAGAMGWNGVRASVVGGSCTTALTFTRFSGRIRAVCSVPLVNGATDYESVRVSVQGMNIWAWDVPVSNIISHTGSTYGLAFDTMTGVLMTPPLNAGFYTVKAEYPGSGLTRSHSVMLASGETKTIAMNLKAPTFTISGNVTIDQANKPAGISAISVLVDTAAYYNSTSVQVDGTWYSTSSFRVYALDYEKEKQSAASITPAPGLANVRSAVVNPDGSFSITGCVPSVYQLKVEALELDGNWSNGREMAPLSQIVAVPSADVTGIALSASKGASVTGSVTLPAGYYASAGSTNFQVRLVPAAQFTFEKLVNNTLAGGMDIQSAVLFFANGLTRQDYQFSCVAPGQYFLIIKNDTLPKQYADAVVPLTIDSASTQQRKDITLSKGGTIVFTLRDTDSKTVITPLNRDKMLPWSYGISAMSNPWIPGGYGSIMHGDMESKFKLVCLPEGTYDLTLGQSSYAMGMAAAAGGTAATAGGNQTNYAAKTLSGIQVKSGQTLDLGIIDIQQGITLNGTIKDASGTPLPNIPVVAVPALSDEWSSKLYGYTDINGRYSIAGLTPEKPYYDIIACPRIDPSLMGGYCFFGVGGLNYGESARRMVKIAETTAVDFVLREAKGSVTGRIITDDGHPLHNPDDVNLPTAKIYLQPTDSFPRTNALGDITATTATDGAFTIESLPAGTYRLVALSGGYGSYATQVTIADTAVSLGTITVRQGAKLTGSIVKNDGTNPSTTEVVSVTAATDDLSEVIVGSLIVSGGKTVTGYELNGFLPGSAYNIMFLTEGNELVPALNGFTVPFSSAATTGYTLTFAPGAPAVFSRARKDGDIFTVYFTLTSALRDAGVADNDLASLITVTAGGGTIASALIAPDRKTLSCTYTPGAGETSFTLRLRGYVRTINPATGSAFTVDESFLYYTGVGARNKTRISNLRGGKVTLDGDSSAVEFSPGSFEGGSSTAAVAIDFSRAENIDAIVDRSPAWGAPKLSIPRVAAAYPNVLHRAMLLASAAGVDPFSSFYDIMLPAGVSRVLKNDAVLSLGYAGGADPSELNIYYYDPVNNVYLLENRSRSVDTDNGTISVSISHASVFVILRTNAPSVQGNTYAGPLFVYNYPNPFNLDAKTVPVANAPANTVNPNITGTMIHYGLPPEMDGRVRMRIYNVAGELVRTLDEGEKTGGSHYYAHWDGANDAGKKVATGVYIARFTVDDKHEKFFKLAVIK